MSKHTIADGWRIATVAAAGQLGLPLSYTVGLTGHGLPELAVQGLTGSRAKDLLTTAAEYTITHGEPLGGQRIDNTFGELAVAVIDIDDTTVLPEAREIYGPLITARQLIWPDPQGLMPWQGWSLGDAQEMLAGPPF